MPSELLLYDLTDSPYCAKVRMILNLKGVTWRRVTLTLARRRELKQLNPIGKVPVLVDGSRVVPDSSDIVRYLEEQFPEPVLVPADPAASAYSTVLEDWADEALGPVVGAFKWLNPENRARAVATTIDELAPGMLRPLVSLGVARRARRQLAARGLHEEGLPDLARRMRESLRVIKTLLEGRPFLLGRQPLLCDIAIFAQLSWMRGYAEGRLLDDVPLVLEWCERLRAIPAIDAALSS